MHFQGGGGQLIKHPVCSSLSDQIKTFVQDIEKVKVWTGDTDEPKHVIINTEWGAFGDHGELDNIKTR